MNQLGARRVDDRRVISGIVHVLKSGGRWRDCPGEYGPHTTVYNRYNRWSRRGFWRDMLAALAEAGWVTETTALGSTYVRTHRSSHGGKGGQRRRPSVPSRGGQTTKVHVLTDVLGRPAAVHLTPGNGSDVTTAPEVLVALSGRLKRLVADRGYDANHLRRDLKAGEYDERRSGLWTRGLLIRRSLTDGELAFFST